MSLLEECKYYFSSWTIVIAGFVLITIYFGWEGFCCHVVRTRHHRAGEGSARTALRRGLRNDRAEWAHWFHGHDQQSLRLVPFFRAGEIGLPSLAPWAAPWRFSQHLTPRLSA